MQDSTNGKKKKKKKTEAFSNNVCKHLQLCMNLN